MEKGITLSFSEDRPEMRELLEFNHQLSDIHGAAGVLSWDRETYMPNGASQARANQLATLAGIAHRLLVSDETRQLLDKLTVLKQCAELTHCDVALIRELNRAYNRVKKVPQQLVENIERTTSEGTEIWQKARKESDFKLFRGVLKKIVELKLKEADCVGYVETPYNLFLDDFEAGLTVNLVDKMFSTLKDITTDILGKIGNSDVHIDQSILKADIPRDKLMAFTEEILKVMDFDFNCGRQDVSTHPMTINFDPTDVRVTTRFGEQFFTSSIYSSMHEGGHALYELGVDRTLSRTMLAGGTSLGIHESQSRLWENYIGRSLEFWRFLYVNVIQIWNETDTKAFPIDFFRAVNKVEPNLIRVDSDEVTYNLHVILRYEIERDLLEGRIGVDDMPEIWNAKIKQYLGLEVPDDARGVLQDVHWSHGSFGYFPTYSLGNLYAAQLYYVLAKEIGEAELMDHVSSGNLIPVREWLRDKVHCYGSVFQADELIRKATGESLNSEYFRRYLNDKFRSIYQFKDREIEGF